MTSATCLRFCWFRNVYHVTMFTVCILLLFICFSFQINMKMILFLLFVSVIWKMWVVPERTTSVTYGMIKCVCCGVVRLSYDRKYIRVLIVSIYLTDWRYGSVSIWVKKSFQCLLRYRYWFGYNLSYENTKWPQAKFFVIGSSFDLNWLLKNITYCFSEVVLTFFYESTTNFNSKDVSYRKNLKKWSSGHFSGQETKLIT